jgi:hypothetical protein
MAGGGEIVAVHAALVLAGFVVDVADDRFDGGPASHLALDRLRHPSLLTGGRDPEPVACLRIVALVSGIGEDARDLGPGRGLSVSGMMVPSVWPS